MLTRLPAPAAVPLLGHLLHFSPWGRYGGLENLPAALLDLQRRHGPILRLTLGTDMVMLFKPEDVRAMFRAEGRYPRRPPFPALQQYRRSRPQWYRNAGLVTENGQEWLRIRRAVNFLLRVENARRHAPLHWEVSQELVVRWRGRPSVLLLPELHRFTLEASAALCFGTRLGALRPGTRAVTRPVAAAQDSLRGMAATLLGLPLWRLYPTAPYRLLRDSQDFFYRFTEENARKNPSELFAILSENPDLDQRDVLLLLSELFFAGIDTAASTIAFLLYHLATNQEVQDRLREEVLSRPESLDLPYLRACMKESNRLTPAASGSARILDHETELSGYKIPADTLCIGIHFVMGRTVVPRPTHFAPERWLPGADKPHPYLVLPFGHGPRRCVGQRVAEQMILTCVSKVVENFRLTYHGPPLGIKAQLNWMPDPPIELELRPV